MRRPLFITILIGFVLIASGTGLSERGASISSNNKTEMLQKGVWIGDILNNSTNYDGKLVFIAGTYDGWNAHRTINVPPPVTRSDWVIRDDTGSIYVTGINPRLDPIRTLESV